MVTREELVGKSREELVEVAKKLNIKVHYKAKEETIIHQICQQPVALQANALKHVAETPAAPVVMNTQEQIMEVIATHAAREGFKVTFNPDNTWHFAFRGAEDSGHMNIPLRAIKMKADVVARGAMRPMGFSPNDGFDNAVSRGYANSVLTT